MSTPIWESYRKIVQQFFSFPFEAIVKDEIAAAVFFSVLFAQPVGWIYHEHGLGIQDLVEES